MAKKQFNTPELNLKAELPQVVSRDFNLFYKPEAEPEIAGLKNFTQSLDNFINGALTTGNILGETKLKEQSEAEATQFFNMEVENKKAFNSAVNKNEIPREANPYFVDKLKELELGTKVQEFKRKFKERYAKENLSENTDPNAFNFIYEQELKQFLKDNNIGLYEPTELEKNFFSKTSQFREAEENMHMNNQLSKIREQFDKNYKTGIQDLFNPDADIETIGKNVSDFIKSATESGMSNNRAREMFMETLKEYVEATGDIDFASKLVTELPSYIQLGTDVLGNVNSLKDDFSQLEDSIMDRELLEREEELKKEELLQKEKDNQVERLTNEYEYFSDFKNSKEYQDLDFSQKNYARKIYKDRQVGYGEFDTQENIDEVNNLIKLNDLEGAKEYLNNHKTDFRENTWFNLYEKIRTYEITKKDTLTGIDEYTEYSKEIQGIVDGINNQYKGVGDAFFGTAVAEYQTELNKWLRYHPLEDFKNDWEREQAFKDFALKKKDEAKANIIAGFPTQNRVLEPTIYDNQNPNLNEEIVEITIDEVDAVEQNTNDTTDIIINSNAKAITIIPEDLKGKDLLKFKKQYPDAMTKEEYLKQIEMQKTKEKLPKENPRG